MGRIYTTLACGCMVSADKGGGMIPGSDCNSPECQFWEWEKANMGGDAMSGCGPDGDVCGISRNSPEEYRWTEGRFLSCPNHASRHAAVDKLVEALQATELVLIFGLLEEKADDLRNEIKDALRAAGEVRRDE